MRLTVPRWHWSTELKNDIPLIKALETAPRKMLSSSARAALWKENIWARYVSCVLEIDDVKCVSANHAPRARYAHVSVTYMHALLGSSQVFSFNTFSLYLEVNHFQPPLPSLLACTSLSPSTAHMDRNGVRACAPFIATTPRSSAVVHF